jgi:hypothetical protein
MEWAALVTWVLTAGGGFFLLALWLKHGGMQQSGAPGARIRAGRILGHFAVAAIGLVLWIVYLASDNDTLAWIAFGLLLLVALVGFSMLATWLGQRRGGAGATAPAEQRFPVAVVGLHGVLAATTLVLVALAAAGVGGS